MAEARKTVTVVFSDVSGSTALGEQTDPETMRRVMERYFAETRAVLENHGGTVEKFIGDAVMAVFGIPTVHEDDALRAVRAAADMRERLAALNEELERERGITIAVRTGVNTGEVVAGDPAAGQAFASGDPVNVAARLEQAAEPGDILLGPLTYELVREAVRAEAVAPLDLKGKSQPLEAWRLVDVLPHAPAFTRRIDAPFVGRAAELAALREVYETARADGACRLVTVVGAPGIGKSRLVRELITSVGDEAKVVVGRCLSYGEGITYWPLAEIVRQVAGGDLRQGLLALLGDDPDASLAAERLLGAVGATDEPARTEEIFWATRILFERLARDRPLVAVIDDIHWAEPTMLDLLEYLAGFTRGSVVLTCTARPDLFDARPHWPRATTVELGSLDDREADELIDALLSGSDLSTDVRERIAEKAEGNPLFVEQMLALAGEDGTRELVVPATIQALLAARLEHLDAAERAAVIRGAVEGRVFHRGAVSALLPEAERDGVPGRLLSLTRKSFVRPDEALFPGDEAFRFVHVLVRDAAYAGAPKELRAELHERFADWLEARAPELDEIVGYHLEQSCNYRRSLGERADSLAARAGAQLAEAGRRADRRGDTLATLNLLTRALELLPPDHRAVLDLALTRGRALVDAGDLERAREAFETASSRALQLGSDVHQAAAQLELALMRRMSDPGWTGEKTRAIAEEAVPLFEAAADEGGLARAWYAKHVAEADAGRLEASEAASRKSLEHARRADDPAAIAAAFTALGSSMWYSAASMTELVPVHEDFFAWARESGHLTSEAEMLVVFGRFKLEAGQREEAEDLIGRGLAMLRALGLELRALSMEAWFSWGEYVEDPEAVEKGVRAFYDALRSVGETGVRSTNAASLAFIIARRGALDEAEQLSLESELTGAEDDLVTQVAWRTARAAVLARRGSFAEAEQMARASLEHALAAEFAEQTAFAHIGLADVLILAGRARDAAQQLEHALEIFDRKEFALSADAVRAQLAELQSSGSPSQ